MLDKLCIKNFKKFEYLELENLSRVNLFVGDNNVGKTTALEAIFSFSCKNSLPAKFTNLSHSDKSAVRKIIDKYDGLFDIKEYLQNAGDIELAPQTQQYILECAESFDEYVLSYDKSKDKVIK